jgi:hypothetical protein
MLKYVCYKVRWDKKKNYEKGKKTTAATTALCQAKDGVVAECRI